MNYLGTILLGLLLLLPATSQAQPRRYERQSEDAPRDRIESYKKVRMLEVLKLDEEQSAKFVTRYNKHQETMRGFEKERNTLVDKLDNEVQGSASDAEFDETFNVLIDLDKKISGQRLQFLNELKDVLSNHQIAEYVVFERNFVRELRQAIRDVQKDRMRDK